jgi:hypothetical protein
MSCQHGMNNVAVSSLFIALTRASHLSLSSATIHSTPNYPAVSRSILILSIHLLRTQIRCFLYPLCAFFTYRMCELQSCVLWFSLLGSKEFVNDTCGWASICQRFEELCCLHLQRNADKEVHLLHIPVRICGNNWCS